VWQNQSELASSTHNICLSFRMGPSSSSLLAIRDVIYLHFQINSLPGHRKKLNSYHVTIKHISVKQVTQSKKGLCRMMICTVAKRVIATGFTRWSAPAPWGTEQDGESVNPAKMKLHLGYHNPFVSTQTEAQKQFV